MSTHTEEEQRVLVGAALRIQCVFRVSRARREIKARSVQRKAAFEQQCEADLATSAAVTLQAAQRRKAAQARVAGLKSSTDVSRAATPTKRVAADGSGDPKQIEIHPPSLRESMSEAHQHRAAPSALKSPSERSPRGRESVRFVPRRASKAGSTASSGGRSSCVTIDGEMTFAEVMKSGVYESSASFMGASVFGREGLNTAFALASVASFAMLMRDDPQTANQLKVWDPSMLHPTLIHECAALVIQGKWRVHEARCRVMRMKRERAEQRLQDDDQQLKAVSAVAIQRNFRGHATRVHGLSGSAQPSNARQARPVTPAKAAPLSPTTAAIKIQSRQRTIVAKSEVQRRRSERQVRFAAEVEESLLDNAALTIQATQRRHAEQRRFQQRLLQGSATAEAKKDIDGGDSAEAASSGPSISPPAPQPPTSSRADKLRNTVASAHVTPGTGTGLSAVFTAAMSALMDKSAPPDGAPRCMFWGVRALHTVTMDIALEASNDGGGEPRLPNLEVSRWIQGPLGSVVPKTAYVASGAPRR